MNHDYSPVSASQSANLFTLAMGPLRMVVDAGRGARITEFSFEHANVLTGPDVNPDNYGCTFWPSPQSCWCAAGGGCWPPIAAIDCDPYAGNVDGERPSLQLTSALATLGRFAGSRITLTKTFTPVVASGAVDVTYTIRNCSGAVAVTMAPWEISRVRGTGGLTFFAKGLSEPTYMPGSDGSSFSLVDRGGICWYKFSPVAESSKAFADARGWVAHATESGLLMLLTYPDLGPGEAAPGEAELELFTGKTEGNYVEIEPQGALCTIAPGESHSWSVRWKLRPIPSGIAVEVGSAGLADFAAELKSQ